MSLIEAIQRAVAPMLPPPVVTGTVIAVDENAMTCDVEIPNKPTRYDVRLRSVIDEAESGMLIVPKLQSKVIIDTIEGRKTASYVAMFSEVKTIKYPEVESMELISDENGGVVISEELVKKLNAIEQDLNDLKIAFTSWVPAGTLADAGALSTALTNYQAKTLSLTKSSDLESKTVKHG